MACNYQKKVLYLIKKKPRYLLANMRKQAERVR